MERPRGHCGYSQVGRGGVRGKMGGETVEPREAS